MVTAAGSAPAGVFVFVKAALPVLVEVMVPVIIVFVKAVLTVLIEVMVPVTMVFVKAVLTVLVKAVSPVVIVFMESGADGVLPGSAFPLCHGDGRKGHLLCKRCLHWRHLFPRDGRQDFPFLPSGAYE